VTGMRALLEAVDEAARVAGAVALSHYRAHLSGRSLGVETKGDGSPVSIADREAERAARAFLESRFPDYGIVGEELGETRRGAPRTFYLDPIDGTRSFLAGVPLWGTLIALTEGEEVLAGACYFPVTAEGAAAARGEGCIMHGFANGAAKVSTVSELAQATVLTTDERFPDAPHCVPHWRNLAAKARNARTWGDAYGYFAVATGRAELMTDGNMKPWDGACFVPIIEEAGGVVTDWNGKRTAFGRGLVATNGALAIAARDALGIAR
jgi:histidinol-phosphatase